MLDLRADHESFRQAIRNLPLDRIIGLRICRGQIDQAMMQHICGISSLLRLEVQDCEFTDDAFDGLPGASFTDLFISAELSDEALSKLATWMRQCADLENVWCRPDLNLPAWRELAGHPKLVRINVDMHQDATEILNQVVALENLETLLWSAGEVGGQELEQLAKMQQLDNLVLQSNPTLNADFLEGLAKMDQLQYLDFWSGNMKFDQSQLVPTLVSMPNLIGWPPLRQLSTEDLVWTFIAFESDHTVTTVESSPTSNRSFRFLRWKTTESG